MSRRNQKDPDVPYELEREETRGDNTNRKTMVHLFQQL